MSSYSNIRPPSWPTGQALIAATAVYLALSLLVFIALAQLRSNAVVNVLGEVVPALIQPPAVSAEAIQGVVEEAPPQIEEDPGNVDDGDGAQKRDFREEASAPIEISRAPSGLMTFRYELPSLLPLVAGFEEVASDGALELATKGYVPETGDFSSAVEATCGAVGILRIDPLSIARETGWDSFARAMEGCLGQKTDHSVERLCTGTVSRASNDLCRATADITRRLEAWSKSFAGRAAGFLEILAAVIYGPFQYLALMLGLYGWHRSRAFAAAFTGHPPTWWKTPIKAISDQAEEIRRTVERFKENPLEKLSLRADAMRRETLSIFDRLAASGDRILQLGLLGTLTGMLLLFGALERAESANPLRASIELSNMLGSLGLAFGTTIFAIFVRLFLDIRETAIKDHILRVLAETEEELRKHFDNDAHVQERAERKEDHFQLFAARIEDAGDAIFQAAKEAPRRSRVLQNVAIAIALLFAVLFGLSVFDFLSLELSYAG